MRRLIAWLLAGAAVLVTAGGACAEDDAEAHLSDLAACAHSSDQAVCLVQVAKRRLIAVPAVDEPEFAYAPDVAVAIDSKASAEISRLQILMADRVSRPKRAAVRALRADLNGTGPATALAQMDLTSSSANKIRRFEDTHRFAAEAYGAIVLAACQTIAPERNHRPSEGLVSAALVQLNSEFAAAAYGDIDEIIKRCGRMGRGDIVLAAVQNLPVGSLAIAQALIDAGFADEAVRRLQRAVASRAPDAFEGDTDVSRLVPALVNHDRGDLARSIADMILTDVGGDLAKSSAPVTADPGIDDAMQARMQTLGRGMVAKSGLGIVIALSANGFAEDARTWTERFDAAGRDTGSVTSAHLAAMAAGGWAALGERPRATALISLWRKAAGAEPADCSGQTPTCVAANGAKLIASLADQGQIEGGHGVPDSIAASIGAGNVKGFLTGNPCRTTRSATAEQLIGKDLKPAVEAAALSSCASSALEAGNLDLAAEAVTLRAAIRDADLNIGQFHVPNDQEVQAGAMSVAVAAADLGRLDLMHRMVDLAFHISARAPEVELEDLEDLQKIGVAELREQGRL